MKKACALALALLLAAAAGCGGDKKAGGEEADAGPLAEAEKRAEPRTEAERLVATSIRRNSEGPVEFLEWGPHLTRGEVEAVSREAGDDGGSISSARLAGRYDLVVRVLYRPHDAAENVDDPVRTREGFYDEVYGVTKHGKILESNVNPAGADWKRVWRKALEKVYPRLEER